jgi:hypothetical protein
MDMGARQIEVVAMGLGDFAAPYLAPVFVRRARG